MLFERRVHAGIADGTVTMAFRRWKVRQVKPGGRYRTPVGFIDVDSIDIVDVASIIDAQAIRAGRRPRRCRRAGAGLVQDRRAQTQEPRADD